MSTIATMFDKPHPSECPSHHDPWTLVLSIGLCTGLVISYLPQHIRIITAGTSEGLSPWFLLLGATSSASGMLNLLIMQWPLFQCCRVVSGGQCAESLMGFVQVTLQWLLFSIILVLYLVYFPKVPHMHLPTSPNLNDNYGATDAAAVAADVAEERQKRAEDNRVEWRTAVSVAWIVALHLIALLSLAFILLTSLPATRPPQLALQRLATFCGVSATALAICQYAPQIVKTYRARLVGALSLGTMCIQTPGSVLFCLTIMLSQGTNWTSWLPYAVTGVMQGCLLAICIAWRDRQRVLGIDDFGQPLSKQPRTEAGTEAEPLLRQQ